MKRLIVTAILVLALALSLVGGLRFRRQYMELRQANQVQVDEAQRELDAAKEAHDALDPSGAEEIAMQQEREQRLLEEARSEIERLTGENEALDASIRQAEQELEAAKSGEDYEYYRSVYDSLAEGKALVESYLEDH